MKDQEQTDLYQKILHIAEILQQTSEQHQAISKLMELLQWQIVDLNKRVKELEALQKDKPGN